MNQELSIQRQPKSVTAAMAERYGMETAAFEQTVRATCSPSNKVLTKEQFAAAMVVANEYRLNPLTREIFFFPSQNGIVPVVSIDGWTRIINENPAMNGIRFEDYREDGKLISVTCHIYRKDREHPISVPEYMEECVRPTEPWKKWPMRMLRHKALIQCARIAFGFAGIYEADEAERIIEGEATHVSATDAHGEPVVQLNSAQAKRAGLGVWFEQELRKAKTSGEIDALLEDHRYLGMPRTHREAYQDQIEYHRERIATEQADITLAVAGDQPSKSLAAVFDEINAAKDAEALLSIKMPFFSAEDTRAFNKAITARAMEIAGA